MTTAPSPTATATDKTITSKDNAVFKMLFETLASRGIKKHGLFFVFGERAVRDTLAAHADLVRDVIICEGTDTDILSPARALANQVRRSAPQAAHVTIAKTLFNELDIFGTRTPLLVLRTPEIPAADLARAPQGLEILCALSDPSNVGALLRSAAAFGAARVMLLKESASPFHTKAVRAASAATLATPLARGPSIHDLAEIDNGNHPTVALDMKGVPLTSFTWPKNVRLLLGEEGLGVPDAARGVTPVAIPMAAPIESLNATVAASIALYAYRAQH